MLKTIREEAVVTQTLQRAGNIYPRVWEAYDALQWVLVRLHPIGVAVQRSTNLYHLHKQSAGPMGVPAITVLYTLSNDVIALLAMKVG